MENNKQTAYTLWIDIKLWNEFKKTVSKNLTMGEALTGLIKQKLRENERNNN